MKYVNTGAPFSRSDGTRWERDAIYEPTASELRTRGYKLRLQPGQEEPVGAPVQETEEGEVWPLPMSPERYLDLSAPGGEHVALAQRLVRQAEAHVEDESDGDTDE